MKRRPVAVPGFVSVVLSETAAPNDEAATSREPHPPFTIEIETPSGVRLRVTNEFSAAALVRLMAAVRAAC